MEIKINLLSVPGNCLSIAHCRSRSICGCDRPQFQQDICNEKHMRAQTDVNAEISQEREAIFSMFATGPN